LRVGRSDLGQSRPVSANLASSLVPGWSPGGGLGRRLGRVPLGRLRRGLAAPSRGNRTHLTTEWPHTLFRVAALRDVCAGHRVSGGWRGTKDKGASGRREKRKVNISYCHIVIRVRVESERSSLASTSGRVFGRDEVESGEGERPAEEQPRTSASSNRESPRAAAAVRA